MLSDTDDVTKAFPGRDGTGREVGKNWELPETELHQILDENVYNNSHAQYELMLDVNAIQYIRRSNQAYFSNDVDPYTSYYDETNKLKVLCKSKDNQKYCASEFLTDLQTDSALNYPLMGSCLPNGFDTSGRAQDVLDNGCYTEYNYPAVTWIR